MSIDLGRFAIDGRHVRALYLEGEPDVPGGRPTSLKGRYDGSETFAFRIWRGDDLAADATLEAAWDPDLTGNPADVDSPKVRLVLADLAGLVPGIYFVEVILNPDGDRTHVLEPGSTLELTPAPGLGVASRSYCTFDDVRSVADWIGRTMELHPSTRSDLGEQRALARQWVDETVLARAEDVLRDWGNANVWPGSIVATDAYRAAVLDAVSAGRLAGRDPIGAGLDHLRAALDAGGLIVDDRIRRAAAYRTAYLAALPLVGEAPYKDAAATCHALSSLGLMGAGLRVDTDGDGLADIEL